MIWALALAAGALVAAGVYLALSRELLRMMVGLSLIGTAVNLVVLGSGRVGTRVPPIIPAGTTGTALSTGAANPLPQALVLTAIVIGFALTCFSLVLVIALHARAGTADAGALAEAEPPPGPDGRPAPLEGA